MPAGPPLCSSSMESAMSKNNMSDEKATHATRRRYRRWASSIALLVTAGLILVPVLYAVHDLALQLDGDVSSSTTTTVGGTTQPFDWDAIFDAAGANKAPLPTGFTNAKLTKDFNNSGTNFLT